ncbi:ABC transporter permease [Natronoglycomyces albus]|uniref:FtsX-like permease family protein n=1 Tax=Natronoglycomyces albus TaxID=2811108 RepID=A0A895XT98_9ACTN|nr:FtsX-like permease family protein [Natronoglycomyces albus]QSB06505.1 FtsX-like permease family protein [Natronoglycomyces albus]
MKKLDIQLAGRNLRLLVRRRIALTLILAAGVATVLVGTFLMEATVHAAATSPATASSLTALEVEEVNGENLTTDDISVIESHEHITRVVPWVKSGGGLQDESHTWYWSLWAVPFAGSGQPYIVESIRDDLYPLAEDEAVIPNDSLEEVPEDLLGQQVIFEHIEMVAPGEGRGIEKSVTIVGIYDSAKGTTDGPDVIYLNIEEAVKIRALNDGVQVDRFGGEQGFTRLAAIVDAPGNVPVVQQDLAELGYYSQSIHSRVAQLADGNQTLNVAVNLAAVLLILVAFLFSFMIGNSIIGRRRDEIGLLKALGWSNRRVIKTLVYEFSGYGVLVSLTGLISSAIVIGFVALTGSSTLTSEVITATLARPLVFIALSVPVVAILVGVCIPASLVMRLPPDTALRTTNILHSPENWTVRIIEGYFRVPHIRHTVETIN